MAQPVLAGHTDRELAQIAIAFGRCSRNAILITAEMSVGSDRNKKGGTLGGLNNFEFVPKFVFFMEITTVFRKTADISKKRCFFHYW